MGCISQRRRKSPVRPEHTWDNIELDNWNGKKAGFMNRLGYLLLHVKMVISAIVYGMNLFTAINLIIFDSWSDGIKPAISFSIARWIFAVCIILSFLNLTYEYYGARAIIQRGSIVEPFLDNVAFRCLSRYTRDGQGWKRFLVFAELGDTKVKVEHLALFTYASFQTWMRVVICSGPLQMINTSTMYSLYSATLQANADQPGTSLSMSMDNLRILLRDDPHQALVFASMFFSLVIWVLKMIRLLTACLLFVCCIWMWTKTGDRGLSDHCNQLVQARLSNILASSRDEEAATRASMNDDKAFSTSTPRMSEEQRRDDSLDSTSKHDAKSYATVTVKRIGTAGSWHSSFASTNEPKDNFEMVALQPSAGAQRAGTPASLSRAPLLSNAANMGCEDAETGPMDSGKGIMYV